jgi:DNA polymerase III sliding clamp (beta) subunit (PCNA family)
MSKINLPIAELKPALVGLGKVISKRTTLPVLGMVKVDRSKDGWITLTGTDLDSFVTVRLEHPVEGEPASILVSHDDLARITKRCAKDETLLVEVVGEKVLIKFPIGNQLASEHLASLAAEEFPSVPKIKTEPVPINADIRQSLLEALQCAGTDETRLILNGAFIDVSGKCQHIVGTDGRHMFSSNSFTLPLKDSVLVPNHRFLEWKEFNNDGEWQLRVQAAEKDEPGKLQISSRRWRFISKVHEGMYPNWRQVVPDRGSFKTKLNIDQSALDDVIRLMTRLPDHDPVNHVIGLESAGVVCLLVRSSGTEDWTPVELPGVKTTGKDIRLFLNRRFLLKALRFGLTCIELTDDMSPLCFSSNGRQMVVMPTRPASDPTPTSPRATTTTPPPADQPEATTMAENGNTNGASSTTEKTALENALTQVENVKAAYREAIGSLNQLADSIKKAQREQKSGDKEIQSVRQTLRSLQSVKI